MRTSAILFSLSAVVLAACAAAQPGGGAGVLPTPRVIPSPAVAKVDPAPASPVRGYYRQPALGDGVIVFVAEGDLWKVGAGGGAATRLTSHPGAEGTPAISPDGTMVAFTAQYEGPQEVYVMPLAGGLPKRLTWDAASTAVAGWTPDGRIIARSDRFSTLPSQQLMLISASTGEKTMVPLAQANEGAFDPAAKAGEDAALIFVRIPFNGSFTKRYKGGTIEQLWRFKKSEGEAVNLTGDYPGTSYRPQWSGATNRVYFLTDRDDHMNIWSMTPQGKDLRQHTKHVGLDIRGFSLRGTKGVYQLGPDLWSIDLATDQAAKLDITLDTDLDQLREKWIERPAEYITSAHLSPDGEKVVITARGRVFVAPAKQGRLVDASRDDAVRYRDARFIKDGDQLVVLSDATGEVEVVQMPSNGLAGPTALTTGSTVLKWAAIPSPDGRFIAHHNKNLELWIYDTEAKKDTRVDVSMIDDFADLAWSPDSKFLAYVAQADNAFPTIRVWDSAANAVHTVTTDRYASFSPAWSADGAWLFFLSDRTFRTVVGSPWGQNQPDPFLDETTKVYALALKAEPLPRWPFLPKDELQAAKKDEKKDEKVDDKKDDKKKDEPAKPAQGEAKPDAPADAKAGSNAKDGKDGKDAKDAKDAKRPKPVEITFAGLAERIYEVPMKAGNYGNLSATEKALFFTSRPSGFDEKTELLALEIKNENIETKTVTGDIAGYELSQDGKKMLVRKRDTFYVIDAAPAPASDLEKKAVPLTGWSLSLVPRQQFRQMFVESWRLMRDYFYDPAMHGVDWRAALEKYLPMVDRVTTRAELSDLMAQMVGELSTLHHFVRGGDTRTGPDQVAMASLGGVLVRDQAAGGYRVTRIYQCESDDPERVAPLAKPQVNAKVGDVITAIDGVPTLSVPDYAVLLRHKAGKQVLVSIKPAKQAKGGEGAAGGEFDAERRAIVYPISTASEADLRYDDWEYTRRKLVDEWSGGKIGYVHLRAMGGSDYTNWVKMFYPNFNKQGLIMDVRHNRGGNIDSWILSKLLRRAWAFWTPRVGNPPSWNMQYAFRGPMVALCNERTSSDGETFSEGFRRLGLGKVIGTRTWGGGIWLSSSNVLVDKGLASASEFAVYGLDGQWMIEGTGVTPDIIVDNPPHATFNGEDAQLKAAVEHLLKEIAAKPVKPNIPPARPNKSTPDNAAK
jgi:tricorn protease